MSGIKGLVKDTAIYGTSSIIGRFINWLLVPLYAYNLESQADYGRVTFIYSWIALFLIIITSGMETGFFRFANDKNEKAPDTVYTTALSYVGIIAVIFFTIVCLFSSPISIAIEIPGHYDYVMIIGSIIAIDAFVSIPFAYLRFRQMPVKFATYKLISIGITILANVFFIILCPIILKSNPRLISWFYNPNYQVGYILISNLIASGTILIIMLRHIISIKFSFRTQLLRKMLAYSFPILILGIAGIMNQNIDKLLFPYLIEDKSMAMHQLGIYSANFKIALLMMLFTQAFRYAFEPFIFSHSKGEDKRAQFAVSMKYFVLCGIFIFIGVMFYLDIIKYFVGPEYFAGLVVVPIVMLGQLFSGIFFNLSLWYKLIDKTKWGAYFSIIGFFIILISYIFLVPAYGYVGAAWASTIGFFVIMLISYFVGQKYYPIDYDIKTIAKYLFIAALIYLLGMKISMDNIYLKLGIRTIIIAIFTIYVITKESTLRSIIKSIIKK